MILFPKNHQLSAVLTMTMMAFWWARQPTRTTALLVRPSWPSSLAARSPATGAMDFGCPSCSNKALRPFFQRKRMPTSSSSSLQQSSLPSTQTTETDQQPPSKSKNAWLQAIAMVFSQRAAARTTKDDHTFKPVGTASERRAVQIYTFLRVSIPSVLGGVAATLAFPALSMTLATVMNDAGVFTVLSTDSSQFVQNFVSVASLLFSILVGQTYYFMYQQTENVYYALFNEVTEAKSLLEQVALVCQGRSMYGKCLECIYKYVVEDLKKLQADPAELLSARPSEDPLESVMYMTSVGVPSTVYETVKSLRQARAGRLGALQRKLPMAHIWLLWVLAAIELMSFPLLGAGTQIIGGYRILTVEGILFGVMTSGIVLTLRVVQELWRPAGGAYNVDSVLTTMVSGLEEELLARRAGTKVYGATQMSPSAVSENKDAGSSSGSGAGHDDASLPTLPQGANVMDAGRKIVRWARRRRNIRK